MEKLIGLDDFQDTQLGSLPKEWEVFRVGDFAQTTSGGTPYRERIDFFGGNIPWIKSGELGDKNITFCEENLTLDGLKNSNAKKFPIGTLLVAMYGATAGKVGILNIEAATNQAICAVFPDSRALVSYLFYALIFRRNDLLSERYGGAQPNISQRVLRDFLIPIPPLPEQRAIAYVLTTVRQAIDATEKVIEAARQLKRSLMQYLFKYGPVPLVDAEHVQLKETEMGEVPEEWLIEKLAKLAQVEYGIQAAVANNTDPSIGIPILTNLNITLNGKIDLSTLRYFNITNREMGKILQKGDILFNWRSGSQHHVGKSAIFNELGNYTHSSFILRIRVLNELNNQFLANELYQLWSQGFFSQQRSQSSVNSVFNKSATEEIAIAYPDIVKQNEINHQLAAVIHYLNIENDRKNALKTLFQSLLHNLMTGKVRVH